MLYDPPSPRKAKPERFLARLPLLLALGLTSCGGGNGTSSSASANPPPPQPSIEVVPKTALVPVGTTETFFAALANTPNSGIAWATSAGTIDQSGDYVAPATVPAGGTATVTASLANPQISASATITISSQPVTLSVSPPSATVKAGFTTLFTANVVGTSNTFVTWSVNDLPGDTSYPGFISGGEYTPPAPLQSSHTYSILATSSADPTKTASASVTAIPLENQEQQSFPIELGASGVNANTQDCCTGTLGSLLADQNGKQYILSNNHVMGRVGHAAPGEAIVQPGYVDTECDFSLPKTVATFTAAPSINSNVDAAIAEVVPGAVDPAGGIIGLGGVNPDGSYITAPPANTTTPATVGMSVAKSGRTTGLSCGFVEAVDGTVIIDIPAECGNPAAGSAVFDGQVILNGIVKPGDSGSLIVDAATAQPVALVAGLSADGSYATANPVTDILTRLNTLTGSTLQFVGAGRHAVSCAVPSSSAQPADRSSHLASVSNPVAPSPEEMQRAMATRAKYQSDIMHDPAVLGVAVTARRDDPTRAALLVFVERGRKPPPLPSQFDGFAVQMVYTGRFSTGTRQPNSSCSHKLRTAAN